MKIYFAASVRAGRHLQPTYEAIVAHLSSTGHSVLSEAVASKTIFEDERDLKDVQIYTQDIEWLDSCDCVVAEVTVPSLGVGYEISYALHQANKPVLCLCQSGLPLSAMLTGNPRVSVLFYTEIQETFTRIDYLLKVISTLSA